MELTIEKRAFLRGLARTHAVADRKNSMAILSNVLLSTEGGDRLRLSATDLYLGMTSVVPADVSKGGSIAISARTLFDIVKAMPDGPIHWRVEANQTSTLTQGKIVYRIPGLTGEDFPPLPDPGDAESFEIDAELVGNLIGLTSFSMSTDDTRPHLAGALFEGEGKSIRMVTTDGHRLSKAEVTLPDAPDYDFKMLVPHKGVGELKRVVEDAKAARGAEVEVPTTVSVAVAAGHAYFRRGELRLSVKLADEQFPPYEKVIPQAHSKRVVVARDRLVDALKRISLVASDKSGGVQLQIDSGIMKITSKSAEVGEGAEEVEVDYAGESLAIGFNARYLLDALNALDYDEVALGLSGELDPGVVFPVTSDGSEFVGVIMPMRI